MQNLTYMKPSDMDQLREALASAQGAEAIIAGGTNLLPIMREEPLQAKVLVDISGVQGLTAIQEEQGRILVGAAAAMAEIEKNSLVLEKAPLLAQAAGRLGNPMTRNRATIGGNIANASPAADSAPPLLALDASVHLTGPSGEVDMPLEDFFLEYREIDLKPGQVITHFSFATPPANARQGFAKLGLRDGASISVVSLAWLVVMDGGVCTRARAALGSVAPIPMRAPKTEAALENGKLDRQLIQRAVEILRKEIAPVSDVRASAEYRRHAAGVLLERSLLTVLD